MAETPWWSRTGSTPPAGPPAASAAWGTPPPRPDVPPIEPVVGRRSIAEVTAVYDNMRYAVEVRGYQLEEFHQGVYAAYAWVLGKATTAPITGRTMEGLPDARQLRAEDDAAEQERVNGPRRRYAGGVQHAVMWVRGQTEDQPWLLWQQT